MQTFSRCALALCFAGLVAGCSSSSTTPAASSTNPPPVGAVFYTTLHVTFKNQSTTRCSWTTAYWAYGLTGWHVAEGNNANSREVKPGETWTFDIDFNNPLGGNPDFKMLAETSADTPKIDIDRAVRA